MLSPQQLRDRLDERFRVLTGGSRDVLPRQQTLRALIDWSHDLLDERERALFRRLGIFVNGFTLEGAVAVGSGEDLDELDVFDVLASLVDKSLVLAEPQGDAVRYRLLESTRAYALEKLDDRGRARSRLRVAICVICATASRSYGNGASGPHELPILMRRCRPSWRTCVRRSTAPWRVRRSSTAASCSPTLTGCWRTIGLEAEGMARCEAYLAALPADESRLRARLSSALSDLLGDSGHKVRAFELATQAVEHARASGDDSLLAEALRAYATAAASLDRLDDAERALAQAEAMPGTSAYLRACVARSARILQPVSWRSRDGGAHVRAAPQGAPLARKHSTAEQIAALNLAEVEHARGHTQRAIAIVRETLPVVRSGADKVNARHPAQQPRGLSRRGRTIFPARWRRLARQSGSCRARAGPCLRRGCDRAPGARLRAARRSCARGHARRLRRRCVRRHGFEREFTETTTHDRLTALLREGLAPDELARLTAEGAALTPEAAIALALEEP